MSAQDVERLAEEVWADEPTDAEVDIARLFLGSDWLAAHVAAARAEGRESLAREVRAAVRAAVPDLDYVESDDAECPGCGTDLAALRALVPEDHDGQEEVG